MVLILFSVGLSCSQRQADQSTQESESQTKELLKIAVIPKGTTHDFWKAVHEGAKKAATELGVHIFWNGPNREGDRDSQISIVEDFIVRQVDGVVLAPLDANALIPVVERLHRKEITTVIFDSGINTEAYDAFVATDNYAGGVLAAKQMGSLLNGMGRILVVQYMVGSDSTTQREHGFIETINQMYPEITIIDQKYGMDTVETALQAVEDLLTRNQDVQGIFACNESTTVGTLQALESQHRTDDVVFIGFDSSKPLLNGLRARKIDALVVQNPFKMGYEGVRIAVAHLRGEPHQQTTDTGVHLVTLENIDSEDIQRILNPR